MQWHSCEYERTCERSLEARPWGHRTRHVPRTAQCVSGRRLWRPLSLCVCEVSEPALLYKICKQQHRQNRRIPTVHHHNVRIGGPPGRSLPAPPTLTRPHSASTLHTPSLQTPHKKGHISLSRSYSKACTHRAFPHPLALSPQPHCAQRTRTRTRILWDCVRVSPLFSNYFLTAAIAVIEPFFSPGAVFGLGGDASFALVWISPAAPALSFGSISAPLRSALLSSL